MRNQNIIIAIDGPAGAGKSTIAKEVAKRLSIEYIDTGAMYRALTLKAIEKNIDPKDEAAIIELINDTDIDFRNNHIFLDGRNVDMEIRNNIISTNVSYVAKIKLIRNIMVNIQRKLAVSKSVIMDGRDIGSVVFPNADFKFFLTATVEERAFRRLKELKDKGEQNVSFNEIKNQIEKRDEIDTNRESSPLIKSKDAYVIDTTKKSVRDCIEEIIDIIEGR